MGFTGLPTKKASKALLEAASLLSRNGHCKGAVRNAHDGSLSALGALMVACGVPFDLLSDDEQELVDLVPQANRSHAMLAWECLEASVDDLYAWEDSPSTTSADVVRLMRSCSDRMAIVVAK